MHEQTSPSVGRSSILVVDVVVVLVVAQRCCGAAVRRCGDAAMPRSCGAGVRRGGSGRVAGCRNLRQSGRGPCEPRGRNFRHSWGSPRWGGRALLLCGSPRWRRAPVRLPPGCVAALWSGHPARATQTARLYPPARGRTSRMCSRPPRRGRAREWTSRVCSRPGAGGHTNRPHGCVTAPVRAGARMVLTDV